MGSSQQAEFKRRKKMNKKAADNKKKPAKQMPANTNATATAPGKAAPAKPMQNAKTKNS